MHPDPHAPLRQRATPETGSSPAPAPEALDGAPIPLEAPPTLEETVNPYLAGIELIRTAAGLAGLLRRIEQSPRVILDIETTGFSPRHDTLRAIGIGIPEGAQFRAYILDLPLVRGLKLEKLRGPLGDPQRTILGHTLIFEWTWLYEHYRITLGRPVDIYLLEKILTGGLRLPCNLGAIEERYLGYRRRYSEDRGKKAMQLSMLQERGPLNPEQLRYLADDVSTSLAILKAQWPKIKAADLEETAQLELAFLPVLAAVQHRGIHIDRRGWLERSQQTEARLQTLAEELNLRLRPDPYQQVLDDPRVQAPPWINLNAPEQVKGALLALGMPEVPSTEAPKLREIIKLRGAKVPPKAREAVLSLLQYKKLVKEVTSFGRAVIQQVDPQTSRIYPQFRQLGAEATGRMSVSSPNTQQIPSRGEAAVLRENFTAPPGMRIVTSDYSQIEMRILAYCCQDEALLQAIYAKRDLHIATAATMFHFAYDEAAALLAALEDGTLTEADPRYRKAQELKLRRSQAKTINFGLVYGMGAPGLSAKLTLDGDREVTVDEARVLLRTYFAGYPRVTEWLQLKRRESVRELRIATLGGRRRHFTTPTGAEHERRKQAAAVEREGANAVIQGTAADMMKRSVIGIAQAIAPLGGVVVNIVHDEAVVECPAARAEAVAALVRREMLAAADYYLPGFPVEVGQKIDTKWAK